MMTLPQDDANFPARWYLIKSRFTHAVSKADIRIRHRANGEIALWQRRYWEHTIRDETDFERHVDYIHFNPVKHGLVTRVCDWPFSSFHRYVRLGLLPHDWGGDVGQHDGKFGER
jgi:putative transposase